MDKDTLQAIKNKLLEEKARLEKELESFTRKDSQITDNYLANFPQFGDKEDENAAEVADYSDRLSLEHALEMKLRDVNKALESIKKGNYGICKYCKKPIEKERLLIRPNSASCVECKKKLKGEA